MESKTKIKEENRNLKLNNYVSLINLLSFSLKNPDNYEAMQQLMMQINVVNVVGDVEVVRKLDSYIKTWGGKSTQEEQNEKYKELLIELRKDLEIDKGKVINFPEISLIEVNKK